MNCYKIEFFSEDPPMITSTVCEVCGKVPRSVERWPHWKFIYWKHHIAKIIWSEGFWRKVTCKKQITRDDFLQNKENEFKRREDYDLKIPELGNEESDLKMSKVSDCLLEPKEIPKISQENLLHFIKSKYKVNKFQNKMSLIQSQRLEESNSTSVFESNMGIITDSWSEYNEKAKCPEKNLKSIHAQMPKNKFNSGLNSWNNKSKIYEMEVNLADFAENKDDKNYLLHLLKNSNIYQQSRFDEIDERIYVYDENVDDDIADENINIWNIEILQKNQAKILNRIE